MSANLEPHGLDDGFELGVPLEGKRVEELRTCLAHWVCQARWRLLPKPKLGELSGNVRAWRDKTFTELVIEDRREVDLGVVNAQSADGLDIAPPLPAADPMDLPAHEIKYRWQVQAPKLSPKAKQTYKQGPNGRKAPYDPPVYKETRWQSRRRSPVAEPVARCRWRGRRGRSDRDRRRQQGQGVTGTGSLLVCWHSERTGFDVLERALSALRNRRVDVGRVLYLVQCDREAGDSPDLGGVALESVLLPLDDPTHHAEVYAVVRDKVVPRLDGQGEVHVNVSPGTPAMHAVWIVLHASGALPPGTRLWSSQFNPATKRSRIDPVEFPITTYLAEVRKLQRMDPDRAIYSPEARSPARRAALERLARYARVPSMPLLVLGERGTGKTRIVETHRGGA